MMHYRLDIRSADHTLVAIDDFRLAPQKITVLFGESGIGKTLISQAVFGLLDARELQISINDQSYEQYVRSQTVRQLQNDGFFVFQEPSTHLNPLMTLQEQLTEGRLARAGAHEEILQALWRQPFKTHIQPLLRVYPKPFRPSGGEKQRILLAMAFKKWALPAKGQDRLFVFDEPTGSLDNYYRNIFIDELLRRYEQQPFTVLLITHDYSMISEFEQKHSRFLNDIYFKELRRIDEAKAELFDFKPKDYTGWLIRQKPIKRIGQASGRAPVLQVEPGFKIFGKTFRFGKNGQSNRTASFTVYKGELVYLKAPSGMGKTTFAKIIAGLQRPEAIRFELAGLRFDESTEQKVWRRQVWGKKLAMVFQHADEALNLQANVRDVFRGLPGVSFRDSSELLHVIQEMFDRPLSPAFLNQKVAYLSGGQKQRLNLLRALLLHPELIILDEPLNGLDFESIRKVLDIIGRKMAAGSGVLLISHNEEIFDRIVPRENRFYLREM